MMRVVSLVPSWTETLLRAGVTVVGRTRYCVHPSTAVSKIPVVGGTKDLQSIELEALRADVVLLDREENPKAFVDQISIPIVDTHVTSLATLEISLRRLAVDFHAPGLTMEADRARRLSEVVPKGLRTLPSVIEELSPWSPEKEIIYVIWKNPWMAAGPGTYIDDILSHLGFRRKMLGDGHYPRLTDQDFLDAYPLYSSEPFPFAKRRDGLVRGAIVDGEGFSWFGSRGLDFLERAFLSIGHSSNF